MNRRKRMMENLDQDIRDYIERETQDNIERGMPPEEARYAALRKFGNVARVKEDTWEVWSFGWVEQLWQDVRYGLRMLGKNPAFTAIAVLTMALGIGANAAIFSVINAVLLRPLPYRNPGQLLAIYEMPNVRNKSSQMPVAYPDFLDWRAQSRTLEGISAYKWNPFTLTGTSEPVHVEGYIVSANLFSALGVNPALGRTFLAEEDQIGHHTAILSHRLWRECFDSDPKVVGQSVRLDTTTFTVVGVMPAGFQFPIQAKPVDIWVAQGANTEVPGRGSHYLQVIARSRPDVTFDQARAEMAAIADGLARQFPDSNRDEGVKIVSEHEALVGQVRSAMLVLFGVVVLVLLIACANVANLLLARAANRTREIAIRAALGGAYGRIARQLLTESFVIAALSAVVGLVLAMAAKRLLVQLGPQGIPRLSETGVDGRVLTFTLAVAVLTSVLFGLAPALRAAKARLVQSLKGSRAAYRDSSHSQRLRGALIVGEVTLTVILLAGAGLMINTFYRLTRIDPGFNPRGVLTFAVDLSDLDTSDEQRAVTEASRRFEELLAMIRNSPGVSSAAADTSLPLSGVDNMWSGFQKEGQTTPGWPSAAISIATPDLFRTLGIPLLEGRDFTARDNLKSPSVVIVSQSFVHQYFTGQNAVGKRIKTGFNLGDETPLRQIIGVVGDVRRDSLTDNPPPAIYMPENQLPQGGMRFVVRSSLPSQALADTMREAVWSVDKNLPVYEMKTLDQYLGLATAQQRFNALVLGLFAMLAVVLSMVGLYGVVSYSVGQRTHEFGVRIALGAKHSELMSMVLRQGLSLVIVGIALGLVGASALTRFLSSLLYQVHPTDPPTFIAITALLAGVALLACYTPARRATKADPMVALRYE